jgi:hypothetical protein
MNALSAFASVANAFGRPAEILNLNLNRPFKSKSKSKTFTAHAVLRHRAA